MGHIRKCYCNGERRTREFPIARIAMSAKIAIVEKLKIRAMDDQPLMQGFNTGLALPREKYGFLTFC